MSTPTGFTDAQGQNDIDRNVRQYKDLDFVRRIRRWPPSMVSRLENFLQVR